MCISTGVRKLRDHAANLANHITSNGKFDLRQPNRYASRSVPRQYISASSLSVGGSDSGRITEHSWARLWRELCPVRLPEHQAPAIPELKNPWTRTVRILCLYPVEIEGDYDGNTPRRQSKRRGQGEEWSSSIRYIPMPYSLEPHPKTKEPTLL